MSIEMIEQHLNKFLTNKNNEVLVLSGEWGIGKTFLWNKTIKNASKIPEIAFKQYSYISLYGINSINEFKLSISTQLLELNKINKKTDPKRIANSLYENLNRIPKLKDYSMLVNHFLFNSVNDLIICIDDMERKSDALKLKDILGIINSLKSEKNCKVIIILNEEAIKEDPDKSDFQKFKEKTVDKHFIMSPTADEIYNILNWYQEDFLYESIREFSLKLNIKNIRTLKKIENLANEILQLLFDYDDTVQYRALVILVIFCWSFYTKGEIIPSFDDLVNFNEEILKIDPDKDSELERKKKLLLHSYKLGYIDSFDLVIVDAVKYGYINELQLKTEADKLALDNHEEMLRDIYLDTWKLFHNTFNNNEHEFINNIYNSFKQCCEALSPVNLNEIVVLLRKLSQGELADDLIEFFIDTWKTKPEILNLANNPFVDDINDSRLINKFNSIYQKYKPKKSLIEIFLHIIKTNSWSIEDLKILSDASEQDYYNLFKSECSDRLNSLVRASLTVNIPEAIKALKKIGLESKLNRICIERFGIKLDDT